MNQEAKKFIQQLSKAFSLSVFTGGICLFGITWWQYGEFPGLLSTVGLATYLLFVTAVLLVQNSVESIVATAILGGMLMISRLASAPYMSTPFFDGLLLGLPMIWLSSRMSRQLLP